MKFRRRAETMALEMGLLAIALVALSGLSARGQRLAGSSAIPEKVIIDTDIGDDVDDAFALALVLSRDHFQVLGVTTAWGDTDLRARLVERFLTETGHGDIPVAAGTKTGKVGAVFTQAHWAEQFPEPNKPWPNAIDFILGKIRENPGEVTLISLAPLSNVGALIEKDPATFRKLKRVVMMGGSIRQGYGDLGYLKDHGPDAEYNIKMDIPAAKALFAAGVPIEMMPLDATQLKLDEVLRGILFRQKTTVTTALEALTLEWSAAPGNVTPTLFDAMPVAVMMNPALCPVTPLRVQVDDAGFTRVVSGKPNANVCLHSDADRFFHFYLPQVLRNTSANER